MQVDSRALHCPIALSHPNPHPPNIKTEEEDDGDPPRLWFPNGMYPGTAFTRSIGDAGGVGGGVWGWGWGLGWVWGLMEMFGCACQTSLQKQHPQMSLADITKMKQTQPQPQPQPQPQH